MHSYEIAFQIVQKLLAIAAGTTEKITVTYKKKRFEITIRRIA